ncbi:epidermal growth factor-like protein 7 isoform X2 [Eptesicus fuscus]|uniref:epidermal growth factor-like protein 7 isoform X2 n=1 Tax=Eptesicus fuscus TaxID=29078 RepID=UPI002403CE96|nr:epidermal growth factor-like protein 7 isoform X2 [Eptesicus fuscus]
MAQRGPGRRQTPGQGRPGWPPARGRAAATSVRGMTERPSPGHPEEKAVPPAGAGHGGLPGAAAAVGPGAGGGRHGAGLQAWNHLQDCLPPQPRAGARQAALRLLSGLEEDPWAPRGLRSSNMPAAVPERRELCPAGTRPLPGRVAGRQQSDRSARGGAGGGAEAADAGGRAGAEAAAGAGAPAQPGLAGAGPGAPGPRPLPGPLLPAAGPHRLAERAGLLPGGAAGVLFLQEGAVTGLPPPQLCTAPLSWEDAPPLLTEGRGRAGRGVLREFSPCTQQACAQGSATEPGALGPLTRQRASWGAPP